MSNPVLFMSRNSSVKAMVFIFQEIVRDGSKWLVALSLAAVVEMMTLIGYR